MRVLVTGGSGFVGSHVVERLHANGHEPWIYDRVAPTVNGAANSRSILGDVVDAAALGEAVRGCDAIIHLAAVADVLAAAEQPDDAYQTNLVGTQRLLEAASNADVETVLYASTVWVYGDVESSDPADEDTPLPEPRDVYTATKLGGEVCCAEDGARLGVAPVILRLGIPYGPRARPAGVLARFVASALSGEPLVIAGDGLQVRPFIYVEDVAAGIVAALSSSARGRTYNLCPDDTSVSIRDLAEVVRSEVARVPIAYTAARPADLRGRSISAARVARELGWSASTPLAEGVRRYVDWVIETSGAPVAAQADMIDGSAASV